MYLDSNSLHEPKPSFTESKWYKILNLIFLMSSLFIIYGAINFFTNYWISPSMKSYSSTDFLINYQGGFTRRGLVGEIVFYLYQFTSINPCKIFCFISVTSLIYLLIILVRNFYKLNLCWWVLPLNVCFAGADFMRKDFLCMSLFVIALYTYTSSNKTYIKGLLINIIICIGICVHECTFFMATPIITLLLWDISAKKNIYKKIFYLIPSFVMFGIIALCKGSENVAWAIHQSWNIEEMGTEPCATIESLKWSTEYAINFHTYVNFFSPSYQLLGIYTKPIVWCLIFFVIPNILFIKQKKQNNLSPTGKEKKFISILLFQFCSLFPMLTILSCDQSRICFYWTITTFFTFTIIPQSTIERMFPRFLTCTSNALTQLIIKPRSCYIACVLIFITAISPYGTSLPAAMENTIVGQFYQNGPKMHAMIKKRIIAPLQGYLT